MKAEELVGKLAVRIRTLPASSGFGILQDRSEDSSFTHDAIYIDGVENDVVYYREKPTSEVRILSARYRDDHWREVTLRFMPKIWKEFLFDTEKK